MATKPIGNPCADCGHWRENHKAHIDLANHVHDHSGRCLWGICKCTAWKEETNG